MHTTAYTACSFCFYDKNALHKGRAVTLLSVLAFVDAAGRMVDKRGPPVGFWRPGIRVSGAVLLGQHALHQGAQALAPTRGGAPGPAGRRHPPGGFLVSVTVVYTCASPYRFCFDTITCTLH